MVPGTAVVPKRRRGWLVRRYLVTADVLGLLLAFATAELIVVGPGHGRFDVFTETLVFVATLPGWVLVARLYGLYGQDDQRTNHTTTDEVSNVFNMVTVCTWLFFAVSWASGAAHPAVPKLLLFWMFAAVLVPLARTTGRWAARQSPAFQQNTVIVGAGDVGQTIAEKLRRHPEYGVNVVGFIDAEPREQRESLNDLTILGPPDDLESILETHDVERVIIAFSRASHEQVLATDPLVEGRVRASRHRLALLRTGQPEYGSQHGGGHTGSVSSPASARYARRNCSNGPSTCSSR